MVVVNQAHGECQIGPADHGEGRRARSCFRGMAHRTCGIALLLATFALGLTIPQSLLLRADEVIQ